MTRLIVEAGFGGSVADPGNIPWTDISIYADVVTNGVSISRGASDEVSAIQPATCSLTLDNQDGRFTPGLTTSPYYPNVKKNCPIRVSVAVLDTPPTGAGPFPLSQLADDFDDNKVNTALWGVFSGATETGGRARVPCAAGLTGSFISTRQWTLAGSWTTVRVVTTPAGAGTTARCFLFVNSATSGTRVSFEINTSTGLLACKNDVGFNDASAVSVTYSSRDHAWLRIREASGTVYWETSPNGYDWTVLRSLATPAWVGTDQVTVQLAATRTAGATDFAEFDLVGATVHPRFYGMVNEWPIKWKGLQATSSITCSDIFKWLSRDEALQPMLVQEILLDAPAAYYPMTEDSGATTAGDLSGAVNQPLTVVQAGSGGTIAFAGGTGPTETGQPAPLFTPASATAGKYLTTDLGYGFATATTSRPLMLECWFSTTTTDRVICSLRTTNTDCQITIALESGTGKLQISAFNTLNPLTTVAFPTANLADGVLHHLVYDDLNDVIYIDGVQYGPISVPFQFGIQLLSVGGVAGTRLWSGVITHLAFYATNTAGFAAGLAQHYAAGTTGFAGETADQRIARLARYAGIQSVTPIGTTFDPQASQGAGGSTALTAMQAVESTESGKLFANRDSFGLTFMSRDVRYNPTPQVTLTYADLETDSTEAVDDDQKMVNTVVASRPGGATQRVLNQASRDSYGPYQPSPLDLLKTSDNSVLDAANWLINRYADPPPELREVTVEAYSMGAATYRTLLGIGLSGIAAVTGLPAQAPASALTVFVEGYVETIKQASHLLAWHTSRSYNDSAWVLDDPTYSTLGSTTRLAY